MKRALVLSALLLTACQAPVVPPLVSGPALPEPGTDTCGARARSDLIGQDATALERVLIIGQVRVIRPGMAVTMDNRPERINFEIDIAGRVARIYCG